MPYRFGERRSITECNSLGQRAPDGALLQYDMSIPNKTTMCYLDRLELIEFIVVGVDREAQGDFEEDMLRDQLEAATDEDISTMALEYGWDLDCAG